MSAKASQQAYKSESLLIEREASARKNNNHNTERQREMGGQMNWTTSLQARAGQALSKTERMRE